MSLTSPFRLVLVQSQTAGNYLGCGSDNYFHIHESLSVKSLIS
jgi:hypothetical protein